MKRQEIFTETMKDQIYQLLKQEIVDCTLKSGDKLVEQTIADRLHVSRSPVREAIKQLTGDGLVENVPNKGAFVHKPTQKELVDMFEVRLMFEVYAARKAPQNMKKADEQQLKKLRESITKAYEAKNTKVYLDLDRELSAAIIRLSGNMVIVNTYDNLYTMMNNFSSAALSKEGTFEDSVVERTGVVDAILAGETDRAVEGITLHLTRAKEIIQAIVEHRK